VRIHQTFALMAIPGLVGCMSDDVPAVSGDSPAPETTSTDTSTGEDPPRTDAMLEAARRFVAMPREGVELLPLVEPGTYTFGSGTPFDDVTYTIYDSDYMEGETHGYDTFYPVDPSDRWPGSDTIKLVRGVNNVDLEAAYDGARGDRVVLGTADRERPFFLRGPDGIDDDYVVIQNYDYRSGHLQLVGQPEDWALRYFTLDEGVRTAGHYLFWLGGDEPDLVAFVFPCDDLGSTISGNPPQDPTVLCNDSGRIRMDDGVNVRFARPAPADLGWTGGGATQFGTTGKEIVGGVEADGEGRLYVFGATDGSLGGTLDAENTIFVTQVGVDGVRGWTTELAVSNGTLVWDATSDDTYLYVAGRTLGALPGFANQGRWDASLLKIRLADGVLVDHTQWGNEGLDGYGNVELDDAGHVFVSGQGSPAGAAGTDAAYLVAKYDAATLEPAWHVLDVPEDPRPIFVSEAWGGLTWTASSSGGGRLVTAGWFMSAGGADAFVSIYEQLDEPSPVRAATTTVASPGIQADWILDNTVDDEGRIVVAGFTTGQLGDATLGQGDAFVARWAPDLTSPEFVQLGTPHADMFRRLEPGADGALVAVGYTYGDVVGPGNPDPERLTGDVWVQRLSPALVPDAALQLGTPLEERGDVASSGSRWWVGGMTEGNLAGTSAGSFDVFAVPVAMDDLAPMP